MQHSGNYFLLAALMAVAAITKGELVDEQLRSPHLKLESTMLALVDGNFMNADVVERVYSFKRDILNIMWGDKIGQERVGRYIFQGKKISAHELAAWERDGAEHLADRTVKEERDNCLEAMKTEFIKASDKLNSISRGAKPLMGPLIEESCMKRNRMDSVLLLWAHTPEELEEEIFDEKVLTGQEFSRFCIDLLNFIADLLHSCPKARHQFEERSEKWRLFEKALVTVIGNEKPNMEFLKYIKLKHLDRLSRADITTTTVKRLWEEFKRKL